MTMTSMATMTASIITGIWSTMPTEVMMESRENTASSTRIWMMTCQKPERVGAEEYSAMPLVQLHGPLEQQKDAAAHEDEISPREGFAEDRDQGLGQTDDPGDGGKQHQARDERQTKTGEEGPAALFLRMQARGEDGDENEVVDAQHDLEHDQGAQPGPGRGIGDPREIPHGSFPPPCGSDAEVMPGPPAPHGVPDWMEAAYAGVRQESVGMAGKRAKKKEGPEPLLGSLWRTAYSAASWMRLKPATLATSRTTSVMLFLSSRM